jgi:hypothetical protein
VTVYDDGHHASSNIDALLLHELLRLQEARNRALNTDWHAGGHEWTRAIYVKSALLLDGLGHWKWWPSARSEPFSQARCQTALVAILQYALSWYLVRFAAPIESHSMLHAVKRRFDEATDAAGEVKAEFSPAPDWYEIIDELVARAADGVFDARPYFALSHLMGADFNRLSRLYVARHALDLIQAERGLRFQAAQRDGFLQHVADEMRDVQLATLLEETREFLLCRLP